VTYIRATPEAIWEHLTNPELNKLFWHGYRQKSTWAPGADYELESADGEVWDAGKVVSIEPTKHLAVTWRHLHRPELTAEGESTCRFDLEATPDGSTKLTVTHTIPVSPSKLIEAVSGGWPMILSSLKTLLETGKALG
jgi:uncharacterized protein YndB with AHSA1/START domain